MTTPLPESLQGTYVTKDWKTGPCLVLKIDGTTVTTELSEAKKDYTGTLSGTLKDDYDDATGKVTLGYMDKDGDPKTMSLTFTKATKDVEATTTLTGEQVVATMKDGAADKDAAKAAGLAAGTTLIRTKGPAMKWFMALVAVLALFGIYWGYDKLEHKKRR